MTDTWAKNSPRNWAKGNRANGMSQHAPPRGIDLFLELPAGTGRARAVEEALRSAIRDGRLTAGTRLPATRALAAELGLARGTITSAYDQLIAEGWLTASPGRAGTQVAAGVVRGDERVMPRSDPAPRHSLMPGRPDVSSFPRLAWLQAAQRALREMPAEAFGYGDPRGRPELRTILADYLGRVRGVRTGPGQLVICAGYTQALGLLAQSLRQLGVRRVGMEDPALPDHVGIVRSHLAVADIPVNDAGIDVHALGASGAEAVVCTPAHQFPLGVGMSPERRGQLLDWADTAGAWIVEDDYDGEFRYGRRPVGALQGGDPDRVIYAGSVSKALGPGLRIGWIACPPTLLEVVTEAKRLADRVSSPIDQGILAEFIGSGAYDRHLRAMRLHYRRRRDILAALVSGRLPATRITGIAAGLHAVIEFRAGTASEARIGAVLSAASVEAPLLSGYVRSRFPRSGASLVVGYGAPSAHTYRPAVAALVDALGAL